MIAGAGRVVGDGLRFPEGPVVLGGGVVACVEMQGGAITAVHPDGRVEVLAELGGAPNGAAVASDGALLVANNGGLSVAPDGSYWHAPTSFDGCVQRVDPNDGSVTIVSGELPGPAPHRPNDLCVAPDGSIVVTDSANWEDMRNLSPGRIVRIATDGSITQLAELAAMPNGVAFTPSGDTLLVAQSLTRRVWAYPWHGGELGEPVEHFRIDAGAPDGLCVDREGYVYTCASVGDALYVHAPDGTAVATIPTGAGSQPTNCCLGDGVLYVTLAKYGQLVAFETPSRPPTPAERGTTAGADR